MLLNKIKPDPTQPRKTFSEDNLKGLAETIKKHGLIHPIVIIWRAFKHACLEKIPVVIKKGLTPTEKRQLIEDVQDEYFF